MQCSSNSSLKSCTIQRTNIRAQWDKCGIGKLIPGKFGIWMELLELGRESLAFRNENTYK